MQKLLLGAIIGGLVGLALGMVFAAGGLLAIDQLHEHAWRVVGLCGGVAGFVGMFVGAVSGASYAVGGGQAKAHVAAVGLAFAGGALGARHFFDTGAGGSQLLFAAGAALCAAFVAATRGCLMRRRRATAAAARTWQQWFQFRLSALLAMFVLTAAGLATLVSQPVMERRAIAAITRDGGRVGYEIAPPSWVSFLTGEANGSGGTVRDVTLNRISKRKSDDTTLAWVAVLPDVQFLDINCTLITDDGLASLKRMRRLTSLYIGAPISDRGLQHLSRMTQLTDLGLRGSKITDAGLVHLNGMAQLVNLGLQGAPVTDAALDHLGGLQELRVLDLGGTAVSDAGLTKLKVLGSLEILAIDRTAVSDVGLAALEKLPKLTYVNALGSKATPAGLERIAAVTKQNRDRQQAERTRGRDTQSAASAPK